MTRSSENPLVCIPWTGSGGEISILYSVVGATTRGMTRKLPGQALDLVGPLGGQLFTPDPRPDALHVMVGGGYGVPPLVFLSRELRLRDPQTNIAFLIGGAQQRSAPVRVGTPNRRGDDTHSDGRRDRRRPGTGHGCAAGFARGSGGQTGDGVLLRADADDARGRGVVSGPECALSGFCGSFDAVWGRGVHGVCPGSRRWPPGAVLCRWTCL